MDEREIAQWYAAGGFEIVRSELQALPEATRRQCFQYVSLVTYQRLPADARAIVARVRAEIVAKGERIQREIDARL